jgi:dihydropyrimidinase
LWRVGRSATHFLPVGPQYLYLSLDNFGAPGFEGAKYVFTPPLREKWHQEEL